MKLAICLDDRDGYCFAGRRQSQDARQREDLLAMAAPGPLWMSSYSAAVFEELPDFVIVDDQFLRKANQDDWCFVERENVDEIAPEVTKLAIYRWNRHYPSDKKFPMELFSGPWKQSLCREFPGKSHEIITVEVYER